jgi:NADH-quinone oxidoreductase subunit G/NADP-reducing hydrogenase subunit HndD
VEGSKRKMQIEINGKSYGVEEGKSILQVCEENNIYIPHLCYHEDLEPQARCRLCLVEINGKVDTSCNNKVREGLIIKTDTPEIIKFRKLNLELLLANKKELLDEDNEVSILARKFGVTKKINFVESPSRSVAFCTSLCRDSSKCIHCGKCVQKCREVQGVNAIGIANRSHSIEVCSIFGENIGDIACTFCGQCSNVCPTGAIKEHEFTSEVKAAIKDSNKFVIVQTAPATRATVGETQGMPPGSLVTGKMVAALRRLGFNAVLDTNFGADLTIMEEGTELIGRLQKGGVFPMITSCCPGWVKYIEHFFPEQLAHLSSCKSPHQMFGAIAKTYYAQKKKLDPANMIVVSIMPCTAKKFEAGREEMCASGYRDVDYVLTTRELGKWLNSENIILKDLPDEDYDPILGYGSGAAVVFGATGGVMEAALRTVTDILEKKDLAKIDYHEVRGMKEIKEATLTIAGKELNVAIAHGLKNARKIMQDIKDGKSKYHFIEIMACPGGCIGGGGQPIPTTKEIVKKRASAIYHQDKILPIRKSHKNPEILQLYKDFLDKPGSEKAHHLLHTRYKMRNEWGN